MKIVTREFKDNWRERMSNRNTRMGRRKGKRSAHRRVMKIKINTGQFDGIIKPSTTGSGWDA